MLLLDVEKRRVRAGREQIQGVVRFEPSQAHADPNANVGLHRPIDRLETASDHIMVDATESAHELVAAVANNRVEGTQIGAHGPDESLQHMVAGGVPIPVVDELQAVDVGEDDDEAPIAPPSAVDLVVERKPAHLATEGSGEIVKVRAQQFGLQPRPLASGTIFALCRPVFAARGTDAGGSGTDAGGSGTDAHLFEFLSQGRVSGPDRATHSLVAKVPPLVGLVARGSAGVALGGCPGP